MRVIFIGGGTSGHINPALNIAEFFKKNEPNSKILYVGANGGMEEIASVRAGFTFKGITVSGFSRKVSFKSIVGNFFSLAKIFIADFQSRKIIEDFKPDICIGTGGYVTGPFLRRAGKMGVPFVIHEQNAFPGLTTKLLAKKASMVLLANADTKRYLPNCKSVVVGNPLREIKKIIKEKANKVLQEIYGNIFDEEKKMVLSFGGSLGAVRLNKVMARIMKNSSFNHIHAFGKNNRVFFEKTKNEFKDKKNILLLEYINNMDICMCAADIVVCRAGAMTLSELAAFGKAAILIPSPNVAENHQYFNALAFVKKNAAVMLEEKDMNVSSLSSQMEEILFDKVLLNKLSCNASNLVVLDSNERILKIVKSLIRR
jgi:UDP-N-acetylglucosamine--N-acetylmuramyl-(pentapeptide) pyrophosphoryl-undecaprenol N-acetylglucosamine transferase